MAGNPLAVSRLRLGPLMLAATLAGCAGTPPPTTGTASTSNASSDCAFARLVDDWTALDDTTLILYAIRETEAYLVTISQPTPDLRYAVGVAVLDEGHDGLICGGFRDAISFGRHGVIPGRFQIVSMRKLAPGEAQQLIDKSPYHARDQRKNKPVEPAPEQSK